MFPAEFSITMPTLMRAHWRLFPWIPDIVLLHRIYRVSTKKVPFRPPDRKV